MPSQYLIPAEYAVYGLPTSTTIPQVTQASLMVDAYLRRPEGLIYGVDSFGAPCYMSAINPTQTWLSQGAIPAGKTVAVPLTQQIPAYTDMIGEVVILDRANPALTEACVIGAMVNGNVTLAQVQNSHSANCTLDLGLTIFEERSLPAKRSITRTACPPERLISGMGRYGYGRRTDQVMGMFNEVNLLAAIQAFGGPPMWVPFDPSQVSISRTTREIWIPAGILLAYYSEVRLRYISGFTYNALPAVIKQATANLLTSIANNQNFSGQLKSLAAGPTKFERFAASFLDDDMLQQLDMYKAVFVI